ncbi:MAG: hypothetical protein AB1668_04155 [Nanoarchaeota archaeon]
MKKGTKLGIIIMLICTIFTALGQLFFKYGSATFEFDAMKLITNYNLILGFVFYGLGALLLITALKFGKLSIIYPFVSLTFVWVMLMSVFIFDEAINSFKINAVFLIILGIIFIRGSENSPLDENLRRKEDDERGTNLG